MKENSPPTPPHPPARYRACSELDSSREGNLKTVRAATAAKLRTARGERKGVPHPVAAPPPALPGPAPGTTVQPVLRAPSDPRGPQQGWKLPTPASFRPGLEN